MSNWDELETSAGYNAVLKHHKHFDKNVPMMLNHFKDGEVYITSQEALEAIKLAEQALKKKYNIQ